MKKIYLAVKVAMNNAIKHSDCRNLKVTVRFQGGALEISVADDGKGFDPQSAKAGNGLSNMESRVKEMKGTVTIRSENLQTVVFFKVPAP